MINSVKNSIGILLLLLILPIKSYATIPSEITQIILIDSSDILIPILVPFDPPGLRHYEDVNGDGLIDLLVQGLSGSDKTYLFLADSSGKYTSISQSWGNGYLGEQWTVDTVTLSLLDKDNDGRADITLNYLDESNIITFIASASGLFDTLNEEAFPQGGAADPGPIAMCEGTLDATQQFICKFLTKDIYDTYGLPKPVMYSNFGNWQCSDGTVYTIGGVIWKPTFAADGVIETFETTFTDLCLTIPANVTVSRTVPWSNDIISPDCQKWTLINVRSYGCDSEANGRNFILSFGSSYATPDSGDPTETLPSDALIKIHAYVADIRSSNAYTIQIVDNKPMIVGSILSQNDWGQQGHVFRFVPSQSPGAERIYDAMISTIPESGSIIMTNGSLLTLAEAQSSAQDLASKSGRNVYLVYVPQNLVYLDAGIPQYSLSNVIDPLEALHRRMELNNYRDNNSSWSVSASYSTWFMADVTSKYATFNAAYYTPAMPPLSELTTFENALKNNANTHNYVVLGGLDPVCTITLSCALNHYFHLYDDTYLAITLGSESMDDIYNNPNYNVTNVQWDDYFHEPSNLMKIYLPPAMSIN